MRHGLQLILAALVAPMAAGANPTHLSIPLNQLGQEARKHCEGDGIAIVPAKDSARLGTILQRLEGDATPEGLWMSSTADEDRGRPNRFRLMATGFGRRASDAAGANTSPHSSMVLSTKGTVSSNNEVAAWVRPGLAEEYTVSVDGIRQDFIIFRRPAGEGIDLCVDLTLTGATAEAASYGARITITSTGRELAYSRLKVTDANGMEVPAVMQVPAPDRLHVVVQDDAAVYPLRIDPTFSDADWVSMGGFPGADNYVRAITVDGAGNLYVGGDFTIVGALPASHMAKWNGSTWSALGSGLNGPVNALAVNGGVVYAGGSFATAGGVTANCIAQWDGNAWSALGSGMSGVGYPSVTALAVIGTELYAGGNFTMTDGITTNYIAKWNGTAWSALGSGMASSVSALAARGSDLFAGGWFTTAGGVSASGIAKWDGTAWSALGSGMIGGGGALPPPEPFAPEASGDVFGNPGRVNALLVRGNDLFAGGYFVSAGGVSASNIARWDGSTWHPLGSGTVYDVYALAANGTDLYAGGGGASGGVSPSNPKNIAKWDGTAWSDIGLGTNNTVLALAVIDDELYAGGNFTLMNGTDVGYMARWNGSTWSPTAQGIGGVWAPHVRAFAVNGGDLYIGGSFTSAGGVAANNIVKWNGSAWQALGSGVQGTNDRFPAVNALAIIGTDLYAGGSFDTAGGVSASGIARWDGSAWSSLDTGVGGSVHALAVIGSDLYAGGTFFTAGGGSANNIAKWNGSAWSALNDGLHSVYVGTSSSVYALAVSGTDLYAGGDFDSAGIYTAGGVGVNNIAKWDGSNWSVLDSGTNNHVFALAVSGNYLYAGGDFTTAGGVSVSRIARWDGSTWSPLGSGVSGGDFHYVTALTVSGYDLYVGGNFAMAGGGSANRIAKWNGGTWSALGSGMNDSVNVLAVNGNTLYAGGQFTIAGGTISHHIASASITSAYIDPLAPILNLSDASPISAARASLNGRVNPNGAQTVVQFEYGLTESYGSTVSVALSPDDGTVAHNVSAVISGLESNTTYHYRLTATNSLGTNTTNDATFNTLIGLKEWRQQYFGTNSNTGDAADVADSDHDGSPNLLEWACLLDPTKSDTLTNLVGTDDTQIYFLYFRSTLAVQAGAVFTVEWNDTLTPGAWSSTGVTEAVLFDDGTTQGVQAQIPLGSAGRRFVHLSVTPP